MVPDDPAKTPVAPTASRKKQRWRLVIVLAMGVVFIAIGIAWWPRGTVLKPPMIDSAGQDPEIAEAIESARSEVERKGRSEDAWGKLGMVLFAHELHGDALPCLRQAEELDKKDPRWPYLQGLSLLLSDPAEAVACLQRAADRAGNQFEPRLRLAEALLSQDRLEEAEASFRQVLTLDLGNPRAHLGLARAACKRGQYKACVDELRLATEHPLSRKSAQMLLAEAHGRLGDQAAAMQAQQRAAELPADPTWPDPFLQEVDGLRVGVAHRVRRAREMFEGGANWEAVNSLEATVRKYPKDVEAHALLAWVHFRMGNTLGAESALRGTLQLDPANSLAYLVMGGLHHQRNNLDKAIESLRKAVELKPHSIDACFNLSQCLAAKGDKAAAVVTLKEGLRYRPDSPVLHKQAGDLLAEQGKDREALEHLRKALLLSPGDAKVRQMMEEVEKRIAKDAKP